MSRVITFSTKFPSYHPRKGEPTRFIEKIYAGLADTTEGFKIPNDANDFWDWYEYYHCTAPKYHTIRAGNRWGVGDKFSPRIWSGKPYNSKQIIIAPDIEIKKVWDIEILPSSNRFDFQVLMPANKKNEWKMLSNGEVANNDGLGYDDFINWFLKTKHFTGQIICWNENINYN